MDFLAVILKTWGDAISADPFPLYHLLGIFVFIFLLFLLKFVFSGKYTNFKYKYSGKLFSNAEHSFFLILRQALLNDDYEIFAKVRIADVLTPEHGLNRRSHNIAFYRIAFKHFDYVLCDKNTLSVVAAIELDDKSHNQTKTHNRDIFIEKACKTAGLKLIRFPCRANYHLESVRNKVISSLNPSG